MGGPEKGRFGSQFYNMARSFNEVIRLKNLFRISFSPSESWGKANIIMRTMIENRMNLESFSIIVAILSMTKAWWPGRISIKSWSDFSLFQSHLHLYFRFPAFEHFIFSVSHFLCMVSFTRRLFIKNTQQCSLAPRFEEQVWFTFRTVKIAPNEKEGNVQVGPDLYLERFQVGFWTKSIFFVKIT